MPEAGDLESLMGGKVSEGSEQGDEQFREQMAATQAALFQLQQEEQRARAQDNNLAGILTRFLAQPANTDLFLLISRCVAADIPSELIIAVISLIDTGANKEVVAFLKAAKDPVHHKAPRETALVQVGHSHDFHSLSPEHKNAIDKWLKHIEQVAAKKPYRVLESMVIKKTDIRNMVISEISPHMIQLSAFILRRYLDQFKITVDFDRIRDFMQTVFAALINHLEGLVKGQKKLS
jgi:hypothetical protein